MSTSILDKLFNKNTKLGYYLTAILRELIPSVFFRSKLTKKLSSVSDFNAEYIQERVNYYNKLSKNIKLSSESIFLSYVKIPKRQRVYYFDTKEYTRYFDPGLRIKLLFGDITYTPSEPSIVKSRPIAGDNACSVVMKLNKVRHYVFVDDKIDFHKKRDMLIGRSVVKQPHRIRFYEMYFNHPLCNIGQTNTNINQQWVKEKITIKEFLKYKFILCLEGFDVATNLKWVMSSNSLAVMPEPKYETWFMEGKLIPNVHYVQIKDDYSDLEERLMYYIKNNEQALRIIKNANAFISQFKNKKQEDLISLLVLEKYFHKTGQIKVKNSALFD